MDILHGHLHYRCAIDCHSLYPKRDDWKDLVKRVRSWVAKVAGVPEIELATTGFYLGHSFKFGERGKTKIKTFQGKLGEEGSSPSYWGCEIDHPCREHSCCRWRTDITVATASEKQFRLVLVNRRWIVPGYLGEEPPPPEPSVPGMVSVLLTAKSWRCTAGSEPLGAAPVTLHCGTGDIFKQQLVNHDRTCPMVYLSIPPESQSPLLDRYFLARVLAGTAVVYVAENSEVDQEIEHFLPREFRCSRGMVRVYQPHLNLDSPLDARRHRFFLPDTIERLGHQEVRLQIVRACCRSIYMLRPQDVASIDDIHSKVRMHRLKKLAEAHEHGDPDFEKLVDSVQEDNAKYQRQIENLQEELEIREMALDEARDQCQSTRREFDEYKIATQDAYDRCETLQIQLDVLKHLRELPSTLPEVVKLVGRLHADRVVILDEAVKSAESAGLDTKHVETAWRVLWAVAQELHDLFFLDDQPGDKERAFRELTGFDLAMNEGKLTKRDNKFLRLRRRKYNGQSIDISPHVKWGNKAPKCLRVHFYVDQAGKKILIGHCGDHLDNYSTQAAR